METDGPCLFEPAVGLLGQRGQQVGAGIRGEESIESEGSVGIGPCPASTLPTNGLMRTGSVLRGTTLRLGPQAPLLQLSQGVLFRPTEQFVFTSGVDLDRICDELGPGRGELSPAIRLLHAGLELEGLSQREEVDGLPHRRSGLSGQPFGGTPVARSHMTVGLGHPFGGQRLAGAAQVLRPREGGDESGGVIAAVPGWLEAGHERCDGLDGVEEHLRVDLAGRSGDHAFVPCVAATLRRMRGCDRHAAMLSERCDRAQGGRLVPTPPPVDRRPHRPLAAARWYDAMTAQTVPGGR